MTNKRVQIIGAGPGGLASALILASKGYEVDLFEKNPIVGGRTGSIKIDGYTFDVGPTFLMMDFIVKEVFEKAGLSHQDYMEIKEVDPMYRLIFRGEDELYLHRNNQEKMKAELDEKFEKGYESYQKFLRKEREKYERILPSLRIPYTNVWDLLRKELRDALPKLDANVTLHDHLGKYYKEEDYKLAFTFQAKYLGMSPWDCPGTFSIISYIEHAGGIYHIMGGLNQLCEGLARAAKDKGARIHLNTPVKRIIVEDGKAKGVELENGEIQYSDHVVINADFAYSMENLVENAHKKKYGSEQLKKKKYSCSIFMMYLGVKRRYDHLQHHNIYFADDYQKNVEEISNTKVLSEDPSVYIQNAIRTDASLAPEGKSPLYILVPVPNNTSEITWGSEETEAFREKILRILETRAGLTDIREQIEVEKIITPKDWEHEFNIYEGATFNLAHNIRQMLYFRPHNKFEEFDRTYLVGGGTHPGSGLPTILQSAMISADLIMERDQQEKSR